MSERRIEEVAERMAELKKEIKKLEAEVLEWIEAGSREVVRDRSRSPDERMRQPIAPSADKQGAAGGSQRARCPWWTGKSTLPCAFSLACPKCCADPESARMQHQQKKPQPKKKKPPPNTAVESKAPLSAQVVEAAASVLSYIRQQEILAEQEREKNAKPLTDGGQAAGDTTEDDEDDARTEDDEDVSEHEDDEGLDSEDHYADECGWSQSTREKLCWNEQEGWHESVAEQFEYWKHDKDNDWSFLELSQLSEEAQNKLKTCTVGHFVLTLVDEVRRWCNEDLTDMQSWSANFTGLFGPLSPNY
jgi:hypothetical protein